MNESSLKRLLLSPWAVVLIAFLVFSPSIWSGSFILDDVPQVQRNAAVLNEDVVSAFTKGYWENASRDGMVLDERGDLYRPITTLSVILAHTLHGESAALYHLENVLLHALTSGLVVLLLLRLGLQRRIALAAGLLFALAPVHIEPICGIILRNELLAAFFGLGYLWLHRGGKPWLAATAMFLALGSKESALMLPLVALVLDHVFTADIDEDSPEPSRLARYAPTLAAVALMLVMRFAVLGRLGLGDGGGVTYFASEPNSIVLPTMARFAFEQYVVPALAGTPLVWDYSAVAYESSPSGDVVGWALFAGWIALAVVSLVGTLRVRARPAAWVLIALLLMAPTSNVLMRVGVLGAQRFLYLPYLSIAVLIAWSCVKLWDRFAEQKSIKLVLGSLFSLVLVGYAVQDVRGQSAWSDPEEFYVDLLERVPARRDGRATHAMAWGNLANLRFAKLQDPSDEELAAVFEDALWALEIEPSGQWATVAQIVIRIGYRLERLPEVIAAMDRVLEAKRAANGMRQEIELVERFRQLLVHAEAARVGAAQAAELDEGDAACRELIGSALREADLALGYFPGYRAAGVKGRAPLPFLAPEERLHPALVARMRDLQGGLLEQRTELAEAWAELQEP